MDLKRLSHLVALADERSFSRAAVRVHLSQPAFSRSIQAAESELGMALFERGSNDVACTPAGKFVVERARRVLADSRSLENDVALYRTRRIGDLTIGMSPLAAAAFLTPLLMEIHDRFPAVNCAVEVASSHKLLNELQNEKLDVAVLWSALTPGHDQLEVTPLATFPVHYYVRAGHPLLSRVNVTWADIGEYGLATPAVITDGRESAARELGLRSGEEIPIRVNCDDLHYLKEMTLSTDLVLAISHVAAVRELAAGTLQALHLQGMPLLTARQDAHTIRGKTLSPLAEFALAFLKQTAAVLEKSI